MVRQKKRPEAKRFDSRLKALFGKEVEQIIPLLFPGARVISECNVELNRSTLAADLVYNIFYEGEEQLLNLELQTEEQGEIVTRLLYYAVLLHSKYGKPVISIILYPFAENVPQAPFRMKARLAEHERIYFHFEVVSLRTWDARKFVTERVMSLYSVLPTMQNTSVSLLTTALAQMRQYYSEGDFRAHLERFRLMLERSTTMSKQAKKEIKEVLEVQYGYNWIIDENPEVIEKVALAEERGEERGKEEGKEVGIIEGMQRLVINGIKLRFPAMEVMAQAQIQQVKEAEVLERLHYDLLTVSDETAMLHLLYALGQKQRNSTFHDQVSEC